MMLYMDASDGCGMYGPVKSGKNNQKMPNNFRKCETKKKTWGESQNVKKKYIYSTYSTTQERLYETSNILLCILVITFI